MGMVSAGVRSEETSPLTPAPLAVGEWGEGGRTASATLPSSLRASGLTPCSELWRVPLRDRNSGEFRCAQGATYVLAGWEICPTGGGGAAVLEEGATSGRRMMKVAP